MAMTRVVVLVIYSQFAALDVTGPAEVFETANQVSGGATYRCTVAAAGPPGTLVVSEAGLRVATDVDLRRLRRPVDTILVSGGLGYRAATRDPALVAGLRRAATRTRRLGSVCTGAFVLAETGLLDGRTATTHWAHAAELASCYPAIHVTPDALFVREAGVITGAGVSAGIDLALALVAEDLGAAVARAVSRRLVVFLERPGGQSQFSERVRLPAEDDESFGRVLDGVVSDPAGDHRVPSLAARAHMSRRSFARRFQERTGATPARWVEAVRVEAARQVIESTPASLEQAARQSGFASADTMRRAFLRVLGVSPNHYARRAHTA